MFCSLYWCTSWSLRASISSHSSKTFLEIFLPVLLKTAFWATLRFSSLNCYSISWHLACFSFSLAYSSDAILLYLSWVSFKLKRT
jgi:hypothetical protein